MRSSVLAFVIVAIYASRAAAAPVDGEALEVRSPRRGGGGGFKLHVGIPSININQPQQPQQRSLEETDLEARRIPVGGFTGFSPVSKIPVKDFMKVARSEESELEARSPRRGGGFKLNVGLPPINIGSPQQPQQRSLEDSELEARSPRGFRGGFRGGRGRGMQSPPPQAEARSFDDMELEARSPKGGFHGRSLEARSPRGRGGFHGRSLEARSPRGRGGRGRGGRGMQPPSPPPEARSFDDMEELEARSPRGRGGRGGRGRGGRGMQPPSPPPEARSFDDMEELEARSPRGRGGSRGGRGRGMQSPPAEARSFDDFELEAREPRGRRGGFRGGFRGKFKPQAPAPPAEAQGEAQQ